MIKICCKVILINKSKRPSCSPECSEGSREKCFEIDAFYAFYNFLSAPVAMALCSKRCISETAASMCMCDTPLEGLLNGVIRGAFILRRGPISTRRARPTGIVVPLV